MVNLRGPQNFARSVMFDTSIMKEIKKNSVKLDPRSTPGVASYALTGARKEKRGENPKIDEHCKTKLRWRSTAQCEINLRLAEYENIADIKPDWPVVDEVRRRSRLMELSARLNGILGWRSYSSQLNGSL
ncbi:hypothetical protein HAX54_030635 [Datura stramonium]|uniref:Uncharacterized protein n=1 Tax=Datura stramonium TaxID=4076 RepID=A0ABS8V8M4_DATST|nr:hypothetical protein [Datura stramonium]